MGKYTEESFYKKTEDALAELEANKVDRSEFLDEINDRLDDLIGGAPTALDTLNELATALGNDPNYAATVTAALGTLSSRVTALENWKATMPKRSDRYSVTTDGSGDVTITFPTGRYTNVPAISVDFIMNNNNHTCAFNIKAKSANSVLIRAFRTIEVNIGALGGSVNVIQALPSTALVVTATEY